MIGFDTVDTAEHKVKCILNIPLNEKESPKSTCDKYGFIDVTYIHEI